MADLAGDDAAGRNFGRWHESEIARRFFADARKDWRGDEAAEVLVVRHLRFIEEHEADECRVFGRHETEKRDDVFFVIVTALGPHFLRSARLARYIETGDVRERRRALGTDH